MANENTTYLGDSVYFERLGTHDGVIFLNNGEHSLDYTLIQKNPIYIDQHVINALINALKQPIRTT